MKRKSWLERVMGVVFFFGFVLAMIYDPDVPGQEDSLAKILIVYGVFGGMVFVPCLIQWLLGWGWFRREQPPTGHPENR